MHAGSSGHWQARREARSLHWQVRAGRLVTLTVSHRSLARFARCRAGTSLRSLSRRHAPGKHAPGRLAYRQARAGVGRLAQAGSSSRQACCVGWLVGQKGLAQPGSPRKARLAGRLVTLEGSHRKARCAGRLPAGQAHRASRVAQAGSFAQTGCAGRLVEEAGSSRRQACRAGRVAQAGSWCRQARAGRVAQVGSR